MLIISHKSKKEFTDFLDFKNIKYLKTIDNPNLDKRISDHPDLSLFKLDDKNIVVDESVYDYYKKYLKNINLIKGEKVGSKYPLDAIYNIVRFKNFYIHNNFTEKNISLYFDQKNIRHLFIKQGYTRCSMLVFNENLLTSDMGIFKKLKNILPITLLKEEKIPLDGFDQGFLGGCFGKIDEKTLLFNGNIERLNSYDIIKNIVVKENLNLLYPDTNLIDTGSLIWI
ncbi:DUF6873 family GME fold protein [Anaerococcus hydrogenalis]|uniref:DUF6873 domain-containing protein n=1 Tax=Anaerococcus hydrogenalis ACS-025-V-Sch4 TaxID=879306 RepID=F0H0E7_9FIRM|nr:hypothetical protein [Anaerococcus hydrogenalis]EGC84050.1 hypothetical protein HMPREF9246_1160 [Anaerococcus hydrogenalis ACS-025-V-Sch4]